MFSDIFSLNHNRKLTLFPFWHVYVCNRSNGYIYVILSFQTEVSLQSLIYIFTVPFNNKQTLKFKTSLMIAFLAVINHNYYDNNQWTLKKKTKQTNKVDQHLPILTPRHDFLLFSVRSAKMIDGSETRNCWAGFTCYWKEQ